MDIRIENIAKRFGSTAALDDVSLDVRAGELVAFLGPSGSGKTTLLRLIAGLEHADRGRILLGGQDASDTPVQDRNIGFVFQHYALFRHMNVADNIGFGLRVRPRRGRPSAAEIRRRADDLLSLVQLEGLGDRFPHQLSGGQRQRVALARALAIDPGVLLLDEPFGALDAKVRRELRRWLRDLHDRTGHTTVFVTHDQEEAMELADRVVVMSAGRIEQVGTADAIYDEPASPFVFSFIGASNALAVRVEGGRVLFEDEPLDLSPGAVPDGPARVYLRPHDAALAPPAPGLLRGEVAGVRRDAGFRVLDVAVGRSRQRIEVALPAEEEPPPAGPVFVSPRRFRLYPDDAAPVA